MNIKLKRLYIILGWLTILYFLISILFSCGPTKRLERLHKNNPYLFVNKKDTINIRDTIKVVVPGTTIDTSFAIKYLTDTITIEKQGVRTIIYRNEGTDTIYVNTTVKEKTITVPYSKDVAVNRYEYNELPKNRFTVWMGVLTGLVILIILITAFIFLLIQLKNRLDK